MVTIILGGQNNEQIQMEIEIILQKVIIISEKILNVIYSELDYNYLYLSQAIKSQKHNSFFINSAIIKNEFSVLSQIIQNVKLIEFIINGNIEMDDLFQKFWIAAIIITMITC